ncbi:MAG: PD-(D/E)XK nuclease family protein [Bacteroides sp.]|nr:PD-(D/E)XK nuclease family protein [Bacteroides sp.]
MSVKIFYGEAGTGKTASMLEKIKQYAEEGRECMLFVPEQFSFDAERQTYFAVGAGNIRHVCVTGFSKLSRSILKEYKQAKPVADNAVKLITMWLSVEKLKKDFLYFNKESGSPAFCRLMLKTVAALRNGGVSPEDLKRFLSAEKGLDETLADKSGDILNIYAEYDRALTENLDDKLDDVSRAALIAEEHGCFKGKYLFFDNFDAFSEVQKRFLSTAVKQSAECVFCFTADRPDSAKREFLCIGKTINEIRAIAPDREEIKFSHCYRNDTRDKNPVEIYSARDYYDEARLIAAKIHHAVRDKGYRYRDLLVLTPDSEHEPIISSALRTGGIPVFCDFPRAMTEKPIVGFILQIFKSLELDTEEVLKLAESGFKRIYDPDRGVRLMFQSEIYRLRTAAEQYNLRAEDWKKDWSEGAEPRKSLNPLENIRKGIAEPLIKLKEDMERAENGAEMSRVFMNYLFDSENIRSTFIARSKAGQGGETHSIEIDDDAAKEYDRIWDALTETLTSMAYSLERVKLGCKEYGELLEGILSGINLANPPDVLDSVTVGDIERTRKSAPKIVFIAGANEGGIPRESNLQSVFSYFEREKLSDTGLPLYDSNLNRRSKEYYFAYRAMNLYGRRLILTYAAQKPDGREAEPAALLNEINGERLSVDGLPEDYFLNTVSDVKRAVSERRSAGESSEELERLLDEAAASRADKEGSRFGERLSDSERLLSGKRDFTLSPDAAGEILGSSSYSPTRLEAAFDCPLMYFFKYGLKIREPDNSDPETPNNMGTAIHDILKTALSEHGDIGSLTEEEIAAAAEAAVGKTAKRTAEKDPTFPEKTAAVYEGLTARIRGILEQIALDCGTTGFSPTDFEREVSYVIKNPVLPDGQITVKGSADRIDRLSLGNGNGTTALEYARICDYKSSGKSFTLDGIASGKNLQPLLYLFGACEADNTLIPAAVSYSNVGGVSCLKTESSLPPDGRALAEEWYGKHSSSGGAVAPETAERTDLLRSAIAEQTGKKSEKYYRETDLSGIRNLKEHIDGDIIVPKLLDILKGGIKALPLEHEGYLPCTFCGFKSVCGNRGYDFVSSEGMWEEKIKKGR